MPTDCIFCKIVAGSIPANRVYEDELCIGFPDINPQAPTHLLIIPKHHIDSMADATEEDTPVLGHLLAVAAQLAVARVLGDRAGGRCHIAGAQLRPHVQRLEGLEADRFGTDANAFAHNRIQVDQSPAA